MKKLGVLGAAIFMIIYAQFASAESEGNVYLGLGASALALDNSRVVGIPTSSPGHSSKMFNGIIGYQFNDLWAADLTLGTDFSGEVGTDQAQINGYRFFGANKWRPYLSAGVSAFDVDNATDSSTQQIQGGFGVSGDLSDNLELRLGYQVFFDLGDESNNDKALGLALNWHFKKPKTVAVSQPVAQPESAPRQKEVVDTYELVVEFDFDKYNIKKVYGPQFEEIAKVLRESPDISMTIEGHTDWIGTEEYNQRLSQRRANAVKDKFIQDYGIGKSRISTLGYGETRPIADNNTTAGRQRNRRAISVILRPRIVTQ
jgi:OOP family OmpA-OmpF porin